MSAGEFAGNNEDTTTSLYDAQFREYGIQGRWPSPDPAGLAAVNPMDPQTWNRYAYVRNSPLELVDPMGLGGCPPGTEGVGSSGTCVSVSGGSGSSIDLYWILHMLNVAGWDEPYLIFEGPHGGGSSTATSTATVVSTSTSQPQSQKPQTTGQRLVCAAAYGDSHSLAAATGATSSTGKFVSNLFLGNSVSGIVEIGNDIFGNGTPTGSQVGTILLSGGGQGIPGGGPGMKGPTGMIQDAAVGEVATQLFGEGAADAAATFVGLAKFGYDFGSFAWGYYKCK